MKAIEINGNIKTFRRLPNVWEDENGLHLNFKKVSDPTKYGFYDVVTPQYDSVTQYLSNLHFNGEAFTYDVLDKEFGQDLDTYKAGKKQEVKTMANRLLQPTDWYIIRFAERQVAIPTEVEEERQSILINSGEAENAINALKTIPEVLKYQIKLVNDILEDIEPLGEQSI